MRKVLWFLNALCVFLLAVSFVPAFAQQANHVRFDFDGCRNDGSITLPISGVFVCPDKMPDQPNQDAYTGGELGKGWNELDLVPYRLTSTSSSQADASTDYGVTIAAGFVTAKNFPGYDVMSVPVVNAAKSDASCSVTAGPQSFSGDAGNPFSKDVITAIYRDLQVHQAAGTTCVFDWYQRLAVGSSQNPGASLHSYFFNQPGFQGHDSDIPIMLGAAQGISKTMSAVSNSSHTWALSVDPTQAVVSFPNTCDPNQPTSKPLQASVTWTLLPADPTNITITTTIQATNPASRDLTLNLTDIIYSGDDQSTPLDSLSTPPGGIVIPANTANFVVLTHTITVPIGPTSFNDVATGTFVDTVTGVPAPGSKTATASTSVQDGGPGTAAATITATETITGPTLSFSADSFSGASGAFDGGYVAGTQTIGPVLWDSVTQNDSGSVSFDKTVYISGPSQTTGTFTEAATLSDASISGFSTSANGGAIVSTDARVTLTINKNVDIPLLSGSATFTFHVKNASDTEVAAPQVTVNAGQTSGSTVVTDLAPGTYTVSEDPIVGWTIDGNQSADITLPSCSGNVTFNNVRHASDLVVTKTATTSYNRAFNWNIQKSVDKTKVDQVGGSTVFNYSVAVNETGFTDSAWTVSGNITVSNPNDWEDFTGVDVTDSLDISGNCTVTGGTNVTVPANNSVTLPYSCSFDSAPSANSGVNTAVATWDAAALRTDDGSATGTADYAFGDPTHVTNQTITVTDAFNGGSPVTLGTVTGTTTPPFTSKTFTYPRTINIPQNGCVSYPNVAQISQTGQNSGVTVKVCGPVRSGALTIGFWQNKNGQGIITGAGAVSGVCKLTPWLRQFNPFMDLSATASCTTAAAYITNIIKNANASGSSMNAMLKAQMLATALDVYFSDPALGGNKIGAPSGPIGGLTIDLTHIWGNQNSSGGFGGATSMTVMQMLVYASSQSNAGGSLWYGNNKAVQGLAKNAFDSINNQTAFSF